MFSKNLPIWKAQYLETILIVFFLSGDPQTQTETSKMKLAKTANAKNNSLKNSFSKKVNFSKQENELKFSERMYPTS